MEAAAREPEVGELALLDWAGVGTIAVAAVVAPVAVAIDAVVGGGACAGSVLAVVGALIVVAAAAV